MEHEALEERTGVPPARVGVGRRPRGQTCRREPVGLGLGREVPEEPQGDGTGGVGEHKALVSEAPDDDVVVLAVRQGDDLG